MLVFNLLERKKYKTYLGRAVLLNATLTLTNRARDFFPVRCSALQNGNAQVMINGKRDSYMFLMTIYSIEGPE